MPQQFLIPKQGVAVKYPGTQTKLPAGGAMVEMTTYWHRRLREGDVSVGEPPPIAPAESTGSAK